MAVGVGLAFLDVSITTVALAIGFATFAMVTLGVMVGRLLGSIAGRWAEAVGGVLLDRKSTRLNSSHLVISYAVFCLKKKTLPPHPPRHLITTHQLPVPPTLPRDRSISYISPRLHTPLSPPTSRRPTTRRPTPHQLSF